MTDELEYWNAQQVADWCGLKKRSVWDYVRRGSMPQPDLVWMRHPLWLPATIKKWRKEQTGITAEMRAKIGLQPRKPSSSKKRSHRRKRTPNYRPDKTPRVSREGGTPPRIKRDLSSNGASAPLQASVISEDVARQIASVLRQDGVHVTTADVMLLANSEGEAEHERELLRQRVQAKVRGLKSRKR